MLQRSESVIERFNMCAKRLLARVVVTPALPPGVWEICPYSLLGCWTESAIREVRYYSNLVSPSKTIGSIKKGTGGRSSVRTCLSHGGYKLLKNALTEARPANQIRLSVPVGKGLNPLLPFLVRHISTQSSVAEKQRSGREERSETGITTQEDPFDTLTDKIPVQPVSVAEGASYSIAILAGLAVAGAAAYTIFKELIVEPKEYKVYGKALDRVQTDMQIAGRLGSPIHGYGQESQNRSARQRISNRQWVDEDGVEHVEVMFYVRGPGGGGKVFCEMFKDPEDKSWKFTYLIVDVTHPTPKRFLLESYVPQVKVNLSTA